MTQSTLDLIQQAWSVCPECKPEGIEIETLRHAAWFRDTAADYYLRDSIAELAIVGAMVTWLAKYDGDTFRLFGPNVECDCWTAWLVNKIHNAPTAIEALATAIIAAKGAA